MRPCRHNAEHAEEKMELKYYYRALMLGLLASIGLLTLAVFR